MFRFTQSDATAARRNVVFYAASTTDGYTAVTSGITSPTITIYKNGTGTAVTPVSPSVTHLTNGLWSYQLAATDIDTTGMISITIAHASIRTVHLVGYVYSGDAFNAPTVTQTGYLDAAISTRLSSSGTVANLTGNFGGSVGSVAGNVSGNVVGSVNSVATAVTVGTINNDVITAASIAADAITAAKIANSAITIRLSTDSTPSEGRLVSGTVADDVWNALLANYVTLNSFGARLVRTLSTSATNEVTIGTNNHIAASVHAFQNNVITNSAFAANSVDANALAADAANEIADALLNRNVAGGSSTGRLVKEALYALRNKTSISSTTLQVWNNDDSAIVWSASLSSDAAAIPITGIDPA
jgi:hypothetical protein